MLYRFCSSEISLFTVWVHPVAWHFDTTSGSYSSHHLAIAGRGLIIWQYPATWLECRQQNAATNISKHVHQTLPSPVQKWVGPWDYMTSCCSYPCVWLALQYTLTRCILGQEILQPSNYLLILPWDASDMYGILWPCNCHKLQNVFDLWNLSILQALLLLA